MQEHIEDLAVAVIERVKVEEGLLKEITVSLPSDAGESWVRALEVRLSESGIDFVEISTVPASGPPALISCRFEPGWAS
ncbi:MAG TPA: hypothetical protein ENK18_15830 [Deltaproteobacteria bacterium]|nr:hypothetical protein [Deltaproteobacteria bacterium]